jgi:hypothetical protein
MKKIARALALVTGLTLLAGCDAVTQNWLPIAADHRPEVKLSQVTGFVLDSAGNELPGALVSNGASVTFTGDNGAFTLTNVRTGVQYITATYDGVKSSPVEIEVRGDKTNTISRIVVGALRPVSDETTAVKFVQILPDTLTASYSTTVATQSVNGEDVEVPSYGATTYPSGRDLQISLASPPNGAGTVIQSYMVTFSATAAATISSDFSPMIRVEPGSLTESGPLKNLTLKNVGPSSKEFSEALAKSGTGVVEATITLYTESKDEQTNASSILMHSPVSGNKDKSIPFKAKVTIQRAN